MSHRYLMKNIHRYFSDISDISVKSKYRYIRIYRYFNPCIRPDIAFSISMGSQFMNNPIEEHMKVMYHILRYLKMIPGKWLFQKNIEDKYWNFFRCRLGWLHNWPKIRILHLCVGEFAYLAKQETICYSL